MGDPEDYGEAFDEENDYDPREECGRWINGKFGSSCLQAGTEFCDWDCPYRNRNFVAKAPEPPP